MTVELVREQIATLKGTQAEIEELTCKVEKLESEYKEYVNQLKQEDKQYLRELDEKIKKHGGIPCQLRLFGHSDCVDSWDDVENATSVIELLNAMGSETEEELANQSARKKSMFDRLKPEFERFLEEVVPLKSKIAILQKEEKEILEQLDTIWNLCEEILKKHKKKVEEMYKMIDFWRTRKPHHWTRDDFNYDPFD